MQFTQFLGAGTGSTTSAPEDGGDQPHTEGMAERGGFPFAIPAALANLTGPKRASQRTVGTVSSTAGSERGFVKVSGRKIPSVLQHGGDGYGGNLDENIHFNVNENTLSGSSFYRDSQGFYGGPGSPASPGVAGPSRNRDSGIPIMRPSPARTPVTAQGPFEPPQRPDGVGRSHPSHDGSHGSRFTEEV